MLTFVMIGAEILPQKLSIFVCRYPSEIIYSNLSISTPMFHPLENLDKYRVILASGSPRRKELLSLLDHPFTVDTSHSVDETVSPDLAPDEVPADLSRLKAYAFPLADDDDRLVITADTVVILDGEVLGKPRDKEEAVAMLRRLAERDQTVVTGVTIRTCQRCETFTATSRVEFAHLSDKEIRYYVDTYNPLDKAGAYGIQEWIGAAAIKSISGSFYNVMGLPVHKLYEKLKDF